MRSSYIATVDPAVIPDEPTNGYVLLGIVDGLAYVHFAPWHEPQQVTAPWGATLIAEMVRPEWADDATIFYDPQPAPFRWADFAAQYPHLAASPGLDEDGEPLRPALMSHAWAGE